MRTFTAAAALLAGLSLSFAASAQEPQFDAARLSEHIRILSADDMQGRDTGSEGGAKAREYIVSRLEALGVQPSPMGRLQPWEMSGRTREGTKTYSGTNIIGVIPDPAEMNRYFAAGWR